MNLENAIAAHAEWKIKLRSAINKREKLDDVTLSADDKCPLGQWLHGEARTRYGGTGSYSACVAKHADFHRRLAGIAAAVNSGTTRRPKPCFPEARPIPTHRTRWRPPSWLYAKRLA